MAAASIRAIKFHDRAHVLHASASGARSGACCQRATRRANEALRAYATKGGQCTRGSRH